MAHRNYGSSTVQRMLVGAIFLVIAGVGVLAILHLTGVYRLPVFTKAEAEDSEQRRVLPEGMVLVPVAAHPLAAYAQVQGSDLFVSNRQAWAEVPLPRERVVETGILADRKEIIGRVLKKEKAAGRVFTEGDFFPEGTRPGLTAGIPPGKRAVRIEANRIQGIHGLARGDLVDLVYSFPIDSRETRRSELPVIVGVRGAEMEMRHRLANPEKQSTVRIAARGALIVEPISMRDVPTVSSSLVGGALTRTRSVQEVIFAMMPEEAVTLTAALESGATVRAFPRSGRSDDPGTSETPEREPPNPYASEGGELPGVKVMEVIDGDEKKVIAVPEK
jgi:Flp pilus assembly protein CpaB